eukprot:8364-Pleurochrysis_carterae.AAC.1
MQAWLFTCACYACVRTGVPLCLRVLRVRACAHAFPLYDRVRRLRRRASSGRARAPAGCVSMYRTAPPIEVHARPVTTPTGLVA